MTEKNTAITSTNTNNKTSIEDLVWKNAKSIRIAFIVILAVFVFFIFTAASASDVDLTTVESTLKSDTDITAVMRKMGDRELMQFTGLNANDYEQVLYYRNTAALAVDELLIVKLSDAKDIDGVEEAIETRVETQLKYYDSYGPEQCALLKDAVQTKKGNYFCYCVAENADQYEEVLLDAIQ